MIAMFKWLSGTWEQARQPLKDDLQHLESAINQRHSATFSDDNKLIAGALSGRSLADLGTRSASDLSTGVVGLARGGTHTDLSATGGTSKFLKQASAGADITVVQPASADLSDASNVPLKNGTNAFTGANSFATNPLNLLVGQIAFPATQNPSSNANTMDDYEEGTWTPVLGGSGGTSGQTYSTQVGQYIKMGQFVMAQFNIILSAKGTITGVPQIQGLPFTISNAGSTYVSGGFLYFTNLATNWVGIQALMIHADVAAYLQGIQAAGISTANNMATADIANNTAFEGTICYRANA